MNSDEIVESLRPFGRTCVFQDSDGTFSASCELFMQGMTATVRSGFRHATMLASLEALIEKVFAVVNVGQDLPRIVAKEQSK